MPDCSQCGNPGEKQFATIRGPSEAVVAWGCPECGWSWTTECHPDGLRLDE